MVDYIPTMKNLLTTAAEPYGAKVYYELFAHKTETPCVSFIEATNPSLADGDTIRVSQLAYQIRVWGTTIKQVQEIAINIDKILTAEGFKRVSTSDVNEADLVTKVLRFEAQIIEQEV
jgi:hypothetical protein